jgi:hypothetical protein
LFLFLFCSSMFIICMSSFIGIFVMLNEHSFIFSWVFITFNLFMSSVELHILNVLGSYIVFFKCFVSCVAVLYAEIFFQLTIGRTGLSCLCSFIVPCMCGASGLIFVYFHLSDCFIMLLHVLMVVRIALCCCFLWSLFNFVYLLLAMNLY